MRWVRSNEEEEKDAAAATIQGGDTPADTAFHFIRSGRIGEGLERFTAEQNAALREMLARTFPDELPSYMAHLCSS